MAAKPCICAEQGGLVGLLTYPFRAIDWPSAQPPPSQGIDPSDLLSQKEAGLRAYSTAMFAVSGILTRFSCSAWSCVLWDRMTATKAEAFMNFSGYFLRELGFPVLAALGLAQPAPRLAGFTGRAGLSFSDLGPLLPGRPPFAEGLPPFSSLRGPRGAP